MDRAVRHVVERQKEAGIDIGNDGEQQRVGFQTYMPQRMTGYAGVSKRRRGTRVRGVSRTGGDLMRRFPHVSKQQNAPEAQAEMKYNDIEADRRRDRALQEASPSAARSPSGS